MSCPQEEDFYAGMIRNPSAFALNYGAIRPVGERISVSRKDGKELLDKLNEFYRKIVDVPANLTEDQCKEMLDDAYGGSNVLNAKGAKTGRFASS